ncbi:M23 family metallopeptidase [Agromyces atrinae]|uniref:M23 family metallopeptidase n=1 Tax=Agromyces atrinae TaxID=592376 RepID=A0A4Q2M4U5_9MICO|nr:M23 family metallopeptidase [Agromyces atrinae]MCI2956149.1 M23 family metallopeptidase [Agromyces atrinae]NYD68439.1 murein DD-endopeptidase MepM/ murein hydrolase activator NlpD [Agromyces atrinae]RXZ85183.1 M23 family metallopeptidase [Agromyces atrinae]
MGRTADTSVHGGARRTQGAWRHRITAGLAVILMSLGASVASPAQAATYPSWDDVQKAKSDTAAANAAVENIRSLISGLEVQVAEAIALAEQRADELFAAQQKFDEAVRTADEIQAQADASAASADDAQKNAGQLAAQLYRSGGGDVSVNLFLDAGSGKNTEQLLSKLGNMSKIVERTASIYEQARTAENTAQSLSEQASVARAAREELRVAAEAALVAAREAQAASEAALAESQSKKIELEQQVKFLQDAEAKTTASFEEGERIRKEEEARRREEALRAGSPGIPATSGWSLPASGRITGSYGPRSVICGGGYCSNSFHYAVDLGTGCDAPIYAANSGVVTYAGWSGSYGNFIKIDHGGGISTGYAHIRNGGLFVGVGQWVDSGQNIASAGTTGASTGCHLHFEVYNGGSRIDPMSFMGDRGIGLG